MSAKATFWAWEQKGLSPSELLLALCLANNHNEDTGRCDPGPTYISNKTGLNVKTIRNNLQKLQGKSLLTIQKRRGMSSNYVLHLDVFHDPDGPKTGIGKINHTQKRVYPESDLTLPNNGHEPYPKVGTKPNKNLKETKNKKYKGLDFSNLPIEIDEETGQEFVDHRKNLKKPLTQNAFDRAMRAAVDISEHPEVPLTAIQVITRVIDCGWQGIKPEYFIKEQSNAAGQQFTQQGAGRSSTSVEQSLAKAAAYNASLQAERGTQGRNVETMGEPDGSDWNGFH